MPENESLDQFCEHFNFTSHFDTDSYSKTTTHVHGANSYDNKCKPTWPSVPDIENCVAHM